MTRTKSVRISREAAEIVRLWKKDTGQSIQYIISTLILDEYDRRTGEQDAEEEEELPWTLR